MLTGRAGDVGTCWLGRGPGKLTHRSYFCMQNQKLKEKVTCGLCEKNFLGSDANKQMGP
jgi:hypothetical protein